MSSKKNNSWLNTSEGKVAIPNQNQDKGSSKKKDKNEDQPLKK